MSRWLGVVVMTVAGVLMVACGAEPRAPISDASREGSPGTRPVDSLIAARLPRIEYLGGPFLRHPRVITVTFSDDNPRLVTHLERFGDTITKSAWWHEVSAGYCARPGDCVGAGGDAHAVRIDQALPRRLTEADAEDLLAQAVSSGRLGSIDQDSVVVAYLPDGVTLVGPAGQAYCHGGPRGFHRTLDIAGRSIAYALVPRCGPADQLTTTASHEILEAATNPDPHHRGFALQRTSAHAGFTSSGVEPADPCGLIAIADRAIRQGGFSVHRAWSNRAAAQGHDPCVPRPTNQPYLALVPSAPVVRLTRIGQRATITLTAGSDRPAPAWRASALDLDTVHGKRRCVDTALDGATITSGDTLRLTIVLRHRNPQNLCIVGLLSSYGRTRHLWPLAISTR